MYDIQKKRKLEPIPYYFKKDFPDQRFLPFKIFIHSRGINDAIPNINYFESRYGDHMMKKKRVRKVSKEKSERIFKSKEKLYCKAFTNGNVDISIDYPSSSKSVGKTSAHSRIEERIKSNLKKSEKIFKNPLDMWVDQDKKKNFVYDRIIKTKKP